MDLVQLYLTHDQFNLLAHLVDNEIEGVYDTVELDAVMLNSLRVALRKAKHRIGPPDGN